MKTKLSYYVVLRKSDNTLIIATYMVPIANHIGVSTRTIVRRFGKNKMYDCDEYTLWKDVPVFKMRTGFKLRSRRRYY